MRLGGRSGPSRLGGYSRNCCWNHRYRVGSSEVYWLVQKAKQRVAGAPFFGFTEEYKIDSDGVRWVKAWMQSASAYVHDVCCGQCNPSRVPSEKFPKVAKASEHKSLPRELRTLSKRKIRDEGFVFKPQYLTPNEPVEFWVSCPLWIEEIELVITMSVGRFGYKQRTFPRWLNVPDPYDPFEFELDYGFRW